MRSKIKHYKKGGNYYSWLFSVVFASKSSLLLVFLLFISFFIQPIHKAIASESYTAPDTEPVSSILFDEMPDGPNVTSAAVVAAPEGEQIIIEAESDTVVDEVEDDVSEEGVPEELFADENDTPLDLDEETVINREDGDLTDTDSGVVNSENNNVQVPVKDSIDGKVIEKGVTDLVGNVVNEAVMLARQMVTEENYYQFSRQSCVAVGDGTFHCTTKERSVIDQNTAVFSDRGVKGNMEIFMRTTRGEVVQLTDNIHDDTSPDLDAASMRVVWQRMIDSRYQIISYDLRERKETQLTFSRTNSMEPKVSRNGIVWQEWDGNDWEIMFFDGTVMSQITDNDVQDVTPTIEDGYILWSVLGGLVPEAKVYSIETQQTMTITGHDGGAVANPRFVLVYDTKFDNGDVITQGFDPITGLATPISAKPAEQPFDIPEPDPIGEIRALLQNKSTQKDTKITTVPVADDSDNDSLNLYIPGDESDETLNLINVESDGEEGESVITAEAEPDELILTEYDLVIADGASSTNSAINKKYNLGTTTVISTQE